MLALSHSYAVNFMSTPHLLLFKSVCFQSWFALPTLTLPWSEPPNAAQLRMEMIASSNESVINKQCATLDFDITCDKFLC